jgi:hypothetical protein
MEPMEEEDTVEAPPNDEMDTRSNKRPDFVTSGDLSKREIPFTPLLHQSTFFDEKFLMEEKSPEKAPSVVNNSKNKKDEGIPALQNRAVYCRQKFGTMVGNQVTCTCCGKTYLPSAFEAHAGSKSRKPWQNIRTQDTGKPIHYFRQQFRNQQEQTRKETEKKAEDKKAEEDLQRQEDEEAEQELVILSDKEVEMFALC